MSLSFSLSLSVSLCVSVSMSLSLSQTSCFSVSVFVFLSLCVFLSLFLNPRRMLECLPVNFSSCSGNQYSLASRSLPGFKLSDQRHPSFRFSLLKNTHPVSLGSGTYAEAVKGGGDAVWSPGSDMVGCGDGVVGREMAARLGTGP